MSTIGAQIDQMDSLKQSFDRKIGTNRLRAAGTDVPRGLSVRVVRVVGDAGAL